MKTDAEALFEIRERIEEIRSKRGNITAMESAALLVLRKSSGLAGALIRFADMWEQVEQVLRKFGVEE